MLAGVPIETLIEEIVRMKDCDQVELFLLVLVSALEELIAGDLIVTIIGLFLDLVDVNLLDAPVAKLLLQVSLVLERTTLVLSFNGQRFDLCRTSVGSCTKRKLSRRKLTGKHTDSFSTSFFSVNVSNVVFELFLGIRISCHPRECEL